MEVSLQKLQDVSQQCGEALDAKAREIMAQRELSYHDALQAAKEEFPVLAEGYYAVHTYGGTLHGEQRRAGSTQEIRHNAGVKIDAKVQAYLKGNPGVTYSQGLLEVLRLPENAALKLAYEHGIEE
jgi:hypothetical protein